MDPLDDATWFAMLERRPGMSLERLERWTAGFVAAHENEALPSPTVFVEFRLRRPLAVDVTSGIEDWYLRIADAAVDCEFGAESSRSGSVEPRHADPEAYSMMALKVARLFAARGRKPPLWIGFLALIEQAMRAWDDPKLHRRRAADDTYRKAGYRCMAPGCTVRRNLEEHHIQFGNGQRIDEPWNTITLCRFHHHQGAHGLYMSCKGRMPLGVLFRAGLPEVATWYLNERRVDPNAFDPDALRPEERVA